MQVNEVMTEHPICCLPRTPVARVARLMAENGCGAIPLVRGESDRVPVGLLTDRDIAMHAVHIAAQGRNPMEMLAGDLPSGRLATVAEHASLEECDALMRVGEAENLIVVGPGGWVSGIVSRKQIARHLPRNRRSTSTGGNGP